MSKAQINNEIILMRKNVVQARVQIIKKLARCALKLRQKKGTEAQKAKNLRKAERIGAEILAIKKTKKDEITKYVLTNNLNSKEVLENQNSEPLTRIMSRIAEHKGFREKIVEFKNKYPNFMEFLGPGRKKAAKLERKNKRKLKNCTNTDTVSSDVDASDQETNDASEVLEKTNEDAIQDDQSESENENDLDSNEIVLNESAENENEDQNRNQVSKNTVVSKNTMLQKTNKKIKSSKSLIDDQENAESYVNIENTTKAQSKIKKRKKDSSSKAVSKEAVVKRFTDLVNNDSSELDKEQLNNNENKDSNITETVKRKLNHEAEKKSKKSLLSKRKKIEKNVENEDEGHEIRTNSIESNVNIEKEVDPFFVTEDGETNYLSVVLPKSKLVNEEDDFDDRYQSKFSKRKFSQKQNDSFFDKVPKWKKGDDNFKSHKSNFTRQDQQSNGKSYEKDKMGYKSDSKRFNNEPKNKPKSFIKQSKGSFESNESLHPSWEAKKKQQEILKKGFQGKKIVFNDV